MTTLFKMAFRDLGRNRRRSFFSALALAMGLALLLLMASFIRGEIRSSMQTSIKLQSGHLQVRAQSYNEDKTSLVFEDLIEAPEALAAKIAALPPVKIITPRLYANGIISQKDESFGVRIMGIDPASEANAPFKEGLLSGQFIQADDRQGVYIGQLLADKLKVKAGDSLNLMVNTSNGDVDEQAFSVRGTYTTHTPAFDEYVILMPLAKAQAITRTENHASLLYILLNDQDSVSSVVSALQTSQYKVMTYEQMNELILQTEKLSQAYMIFIYMIILAITAAVIVNTLVMAVFERTREIGILSAIGMKSFNIMGMFFAESVLLALGGIAMGLVLGGAIVAYTSNFGFYIGNMGITGFLLNERIYTYMVMEDVVTLSLTALFVTLLGSLYPAILAARLEPVEAMRGGK